MDAFDIPAWVITFMPLVVLVVTYLVTKVPFMAEIGKRNVGAFVSCLLAVAVVAGTNPTLACDGDVLNCITSIVAVVLYWWKGAQTIFDLFTGQLATSDGHRYS